MIRWGKEITLAGALALCLLPRAAWSAADPRAEVAAALYGASATQVAFQKAADAGLRQAQVQITLLQGQVKAGGTKVAELTAAQERFVREMAEKDRAYADSIAVLRNSVTGIAATPEGAAALERFNAGDEIGALAMLDKLRAANSAAEGRRIAYLALEARDKGKLATDRVISRFVDMVALDASVFMDWHTLDRLYLDAGRFADAKRAADQAMKLAVSDHEKISAAADRGDIFDRQGDRINAEKEYGDALTIARRQFQANPGDAQSHDDVATTLVTLGDKQQARGDLEATLASYAEALPILQQLARANPEHNNADQRTIALLVQKIAEMMLTLENVPGASAAGQNSLAIARGLADADPGSMAAQRDLALISATMSAVLAAAGDMDGARKANDESLVILRRLAEADPSNAQAQRDIASALERRSPILLGARDIDGARQAAQEYLAVSRRLVSADPGNVRAQRDLTTALNRSAEVRLYLHDLAGAQQDCEDALAIDVRLADADPGNPEAQRSLAASQQNVGNMLVQLRQSDMARKTLGQALATWKRYLVMQISTHAVKDALQAITSIGDALIAVNDPNGANGAYNLVLNVRSALAEASPESSEAQRDVAATLGKIGTLLMKADEPAQAREAFQQGLAISRKLVAAAPENAEAQRTLAAMLQGLGSALSTANDLTGARKTYEELIAVSRRLAAANPGDRRTQDDLVSAIVGIAEVQKKQKDFAGARRALEENLGTFRARAASDPADIAARRNIAQTLQEISDSLVDSGDKAGALGLYEEALAIARPLATANPGNALLQMDFVLLTGRIAETTGQGWPQVVAFLEDMKARGILAASDEHILARARYMAAGGKGE